MQKAEEEEEKWKTQLTPVKCERRSLSNLSRRAWGFIARRWVTFFVNRSSWITAPIWTSFCFQIFHSYRRKKHDATIIKMLRKLVEDNEVKTCNRRRWTPMSTIKTTIPANIPSGSGDGDRFLPRFAAIFLLTQFFSTGNFASFKAGVPQLRSFYDEPNRNQTEITCP